MARCAAIGEEKRHIGAALIAQRGDAQGIERCGHADLHPPFGDTQRLIEQRDDPLGDGEARGGGGGIGIGARGFRHHRHAHDIGIRRRRADIPACGLDGAADPPEQVDLVGDVEPAVDQPAFAVDAGHALDLREAIVGGTGAERRLRHAIVAHLAQRRPGAFETRDGDANVGIGGERVGDQAVEDGILVELPPIVVRRSGSNGGAGRDEWRRGGAWCGGLSIVGAGCAGGERQRGGRGRQPCQPAVPRRRPGPSCGGRSNGVQRLLLLFPNWAPAFAGEQNSGEHGDAPYSAGCNAGSAARRERPRSIRSASPRQTT